MDKSDLTRVEKILPGTAEEGSAEEAQILRQRLRLFFGIGLIASLIAAVADALGYKRFEDIEWAGLIAYYSYVLWAFPAISLLGIG
ncbi:MAG: hypothetical protein IT572_00890, partial [Deltaproteobacteria bacterium]|nr:hypothetical protein [Deltaproteobacteria bacterium]